MEYIVMDFCNQECGVCRKPVDLADARIVLHKDEIGAVTTQPVLIHKKCKRLSTVKQLERFYRTTDGVCAY